LCLPRAPFDLRVVCLLPPFLCFMSHAFAVKLLESVIDAKIMFVRRLQRKSEEQHCWLLGLIRGISSTEDVV